MQNGQNEIFLYGLKMPTYKFHDYESNQVFEDFLTIEEKERLLKLNPHIPLAERYGSRSIRDVKVEQAVKKWKNR